MMLISISGGGLPTAKSASAWLVSLGLIDDNKTTTAVITMFTTCIGFFLIYLAHRYFLDPLSDTSSLALGSITTKQHQVSASFNDPIKEEGTQQDDRKDDGIVIQLPSTLLVHVIDCVESSSVMIHNILYQENPLATLVPPLIIRSPQLLQQFAEKVLPLSLACHRWKRLYSLSRDGDSFCTFVSAVEHAPSTLLVLQTTNQSILGAFADAPWLGSSSSSSSLSARVIGRAGGSTAFRGGAQSKLFRVVYNSHDGNHDHSRDVVQCIHPLEQQKDGYVEVFGWTGANRYCQLLDMHRRRIAFGGGGSSENTNRMKSNPNDTHGFGLTIEEDFLEGTTASCPTYDNPPLCEPRRFAILELEVFSFQVW